MQLDTKGRFESEEELQAFQSVAAGKAADEVCGAEPCCGLEMSLSAIYHNRGQETVQNYRSW
jgi:hypothetical protein